MIHKAYKDQKRISFYDLNTPFGIGRDEIVQWCEISFGQGGRGKNHRWRFNWSDSNFYFKYDTDITLFLARWMH